MERERNEEHGRQHTSTQNQGEDLRNREYRDSQGNIHHHTKKYAEQNSGEERRNDEKE